VQEMYINKHSVCFMQQKIFSKFSFTLWYFTWADGLIIENLWHVTPVSKTRKFAFPAQMEIP